MSPTFGEHSTSELPRTLLGRSSQHSTSRHSGEALSIVGHPPKLGHIGQTVNSTGFANATCCTLQPLVARQCPGEGFGIVYCCPTAAKPSIISLEPFIFLGDLQEKQRADERTRTAYPCSLGVNCSYWTIVCFTLLDNCRYQRERRSVMRCNERLVVRVLVFERIGEGTGDVFAGDLTPPTDLLGRLYGSRFLILSQAAGTYYGVGEATALQTFVGAGLGAEIRTHRLRAPLRIVRANRAEHQVAAHPTFLRGLDQLGGPAVVHCLLALGPAPWSGAGGEDDRIAALDGLLDTPLDLLFFEVQQHGFGAVRLDVARLLLLADQPPHLVTILRQYPHQTSRRLAMRPRYEHLHAYTPFRSPFSLKRASLPSISSSSPYKRMSIASTLAQGPGIVPGPIYGFLLVNNTELSLTEVLRFLRGYGATDHSRYISNDGNQRLHRWRRASERETGDDVHGAAASFVLPAGGFQDLAGSLLR